QIGFQLGRKNFRNNNPEERLDTKILEVMIDLDAGAQLPIGLPVDIKIDALQKTQVLSDASEPVRRTPEIKSGLPVDIKTNALQKTQTLSDASEAVRQTAEP